MANRVKTSVYIDRQESIKNINNTLENLKLNNINIGFNTTSLNDLNKTINNVFDNLSTNFNKITSMNTVFDDKGNAVRNIANIKDELGNTLKVMQDVKNESTAFSLGNNFEKQEKELDKFNKKIKEMQEITSLYKNAEIIKPDTINKIDKAINKLDFFKSTEEDIQKVQDRVNRLSSSENGIVKLRDTISKIKKVKISFFRIMAVPLRVAMSRVR